MLHLLFVSRRRVRSEVKGELADRAGELERNIATMFHLRDAGGPPILKWLAELATNHFLR